ncbi:hypothetical protein BJ742DRAFT_736448 [Cladochytrium replicatum]|nr:hypothetical protein BJ742DRAFT_736448 [Cladochytrium replicatum]
MCDDSLCGCIYWDGFWTADRELLDAATGIAAPIRLGSSSTSSSVPIVPEVEFRTTNYSYVPHHHRSIPFSPILSLTKTAAGLQKLSELPFTPTIYQALHIAYNAAIRIFLKKRLKENARSNDESQNDRIGGMVGKENPKEHLINLILESTDGVVLFWSCKFPILPTIVNVGRVNIRGWQYADVMAVEVRCDSAVGRYSLLKTVRATLLNRIEIKNKLKSSKFANSNTPWFVAKHQEKNNA